MSLTEAHEPTMVMSLWRGLIPVPVSRKGVTVTYAGRLSDAREIIARVAWEYNVSVADMQLTWCKRTTKPRQAAMWRLRQEKYADGSHRYPYPYIAGLFGLKNHTSVMHGCRAHAKRMAKGEA